VHPPRRAPTLKRNGARSRPSSGQPAPSTTEQRKLSLWTEGRLVGVVSLSDIAKSDALLASFKEQNIGTTFQKT